MLDQIKKWLGLDDGTSNMAANAPEANTMEETPTTMDTDMMEDVQEEVEEMATSVNTAEEMVMEEKVVCEKCGAEDCECDAEGVCNCGEGCACGHDHEDHMEDMSVSEEVMEEETEAEVGMETQNMMGTETIPMTEETNMEDVSMPEENTEPQA